MKHEDTKDTKKTTEEILLSPCLLCVLRVFVVNP